MDQDGRGKTVLKRKKEETVLLPANCLARTLARYMTDIIFFIRTSLFYVTSPLLRSYFDVRWINV